MSQNYPLERETHARLLINHGCNALIPANRLGHEKVSTTLNTYSHLFPHKQQELVNNLEQLAAVASVTPTPEPPDGNPLLEAANLPYGPAPLTKKDRCQNNTYASKKDNLTQTFTDLPSKRCDTE